ncbi:S24/S26 family peptidase [Acidisoma silvae]|uniref:S24/S26 family peptidase n=1 Tax=Acidisoma silvae TaxID=2802396 RepID=A0A964E1M5_9PROT|nr:S24/S26 family peptidase [Acidisoma silvae]MCB8878399.1 S24/S26 family peptidase [Acidisoma silvae]
MSKVAFVTLLFSLSAVPVSFSTAQGISEVAMQVCDNTGYCAPVDPGSALIILGLAQLATELSKDKPFGKNNDIVKNINFMIHDLIKSPGKNNDIVKAFNNAGKDIRCGPGPNNDIVQALAKFGIHVATSNC